MADGRQVVESLRARFPDVSFDTGCYADQHWVSVPVDKLVDICAWLRDDPSTGFDFLVDVTAVHWPDEPQPLELVYHLYSLARNDRLRIKTRIDDGAKPPTLSGLWASADWNERETYDMFGIEFVGHPDLRRILMPEDYTDFPLRREFPLYRG